MPILTTLEKVELGLVMASITALTTLHPQFPHEYSAGTLIVSLALTLLLQGFFRDIYLLYRIRKEPDKKPQIAMRCMCLESTVGLPAVLCGAFLSLLLPDWKWQLPTPVSATLFSLTLVCGFLIKNFVITWRPLGLRREKNHSRIQFRL